MIVVTQGSIRVSVIMCIGFSSSVHGSTADKRPIANLCGTKSTVHQSCETRVTSILEDICWALSSKVSAPKGFRRCTITGPSSTILWVLGSRINFSRHGSMSDFVSDLISSNFEKDVLYSRGGRFYTHLDLSLDMRHKVVKIVSTVSTGR